MLPIARLKKNLEFNKSLGNIIDILKIAASMKLRQLQSREPVNEDFLREISMCAEMLQKEKVKHLFFLQQKNLPGCILGITSDEGFVGGLNILVVNAVLSRCKDKDKIVILGERGVGYLKDANVSFKSFPGITDEMRRDEVHNVEEYLLREFLKGRYGRVVVIYPKFISAFLYHLDTIELLPFPFERVLPPRKEFARIYEQPLMEPALPAVMDSFMRLWVDFVLSKVFWSSKLSELSARLMHLDRSGQELNQVNQKARFEYFRYLHSLADRTIREVMTSRFSRRQ